MNPITAVREALLARLRTINQSAGYFTNAGGVVSTGWFEEVVAASDKPSTPFIVLQPHASEESPSAAADTLRVPLAFRVIGAVQTPVADYQNALDELTCDLVRCLFPAHGSRSQWAAADMGRLSVGSPQQFPPGDGLSYSTVAISLTTSALLHEV
ncbi:hypothetical protein [Atopomonas sediminilitoris]|uniref:hypothetical protein n=1 Tax=Atopomonas sediminilitoris TaxID=2919919 RepID=UPI001F4E5901|nr:hypothetical protein [Atopomonas sediminilitoris]MCJ8168635.1 hypothetical protein [Atopomonas sediminilitoris]